MLARYIRPPPVVALFNASNQPALRLMGAAPVCSLFFAAGVEPGVSLVGQTEVSAGADGLAVFGSVAITAPLAHHLVLCAHCTSAAGSTDDIEAPVHVYGATVVWETPPGLLLFNTVPDVVPTLLLRLIAANGSSLEFTSAADAASSCTASVLSYVSLECPCRTTSYSFVCTRPADSAEPIAVATSQVSGGVAAFRDLLVPGSGGASLVVDAVCTVGGQAVRTTANTHMHSLSVGFSAAHPPPPSVILPSSAAVRVAVQPPPRLVVRDSLGVALTEHRAATLDCVVTATSRGPCANSAVCPSVVSGSVGEREGDIVTFPLLAIEAAFGAELVLAYQCRRTSNRQQEVLPPFLVNVSIVVPRLFLLDTPADTLPSDGKLFPSVVLHRSVAVSNHGLGGRRATELVSDSHGNRFVVVDGAAYQVLAEDSVTTCTATLAAATGSNHSLGQASVSGATATAVRGVATFSQLAVRGHVGNSYTVVVSCLLGNAPLPAAANFSVTTAACEAGYQPSATGLACEKCPANHWSDDNNVEKCVMCPRSGVLCAGGRMDLKPGFFLVQSESSSGSGTIDSSAEFHSCPNPSACVLDQRNRSVHCRTGYRGVLCAVCDHDANYRAQGSACSKCWPKAANMITLVVIGMIVFGGLMYVVPSVARHDPGHLPWIVPPLQISRRIPEVQEEFRGQR